MRYSRAPRHGSVGGYNAMPRLVSMAVMLIVLGMIYQRAKEPSTWRWLADDNTTSDEGKILAQVAPAPDTKAPSETIVPGPTDLEDQEASKPDFEAVTDLTPLTPVEMPAYWRCLNWSLAQSFQDLERRAQRDLAFTQLWEQPEKYRGKPVRLRLHIKRILKFDAPKTKQSEVREVYEAWGWTDESKSFPYVVVFSELPPSLKLGTDVHGEGIFVGYFLKNIAYEAFDVRRGAPLFIGRMRGLTSPGFRERQQGQRNSLGTWIVGLGLLVTCFVIVRVWTRRRSKKSRMEPTTQDEAAIESWYSSESPPVQEVNTIDEQLKSNP